MMHQGNERFIYSDVRILSIEPLTELIGQDEFLDVLTKLSRILKLFVELGSNAIAHETVSESTQRFLENTTNP